MSTIDLTTLPATVAELVASTGKSETTVRKALKELEAAGKITKDGSTWSAVKAASKHDKASGSKAPAREKAKVDEKTGKKIYKKNPKPIRETRKNRITGSILTVRNAEDIASGYDDTVPSELLDLDLEAIGFDESKWVTTCVTHSRAVGSDYILDAWHHNGYPAFCPDCRKLMTPADIKAAKDMPSARRKAKKDAA